MEHLLRRYERAATRLFTARELEHCGARPERLAARLAAKEATFKALSHGKAEGMTWHDVEVVNEAGGRPLVRLHGALAELAEGSGVRSVDVSLSHTRDLAIAQVVAA